MGVIQYRRGERFDRVIFGKNADPRASSMIVRLNTHTFKLPDSLTKVSEPGTSSLPEDRSLAAVLKRAIEASAKESTNPAVRDLFKPSADAANRTQEEAAKIWSDVAAKSKQRVKSNPIKYFIIAIIVFQILRGILSN